MNFVYFFVAFGVLGLIANLASLRATRPRARRIAQRCGLACIVAMLIGVSVNGFRLHDTTLGVVAIALSIAVPMIEWHRARARKAL